MSLELPQVSIIVWGYQGIRHLPATINSILQQTNDDFEILVFGEHLRQIPAWFKRQPDARFRFILQNNLGLATTLNQGILEARGKYVSFINAGDLWHPQKLQQQIFCLDRHPEIGLIHSGSALIDHQDHDTSKVVYSPSQNQSFVQKAIIGPIRNLLQPSEMLAQNQIHRSSVMLRRSCFEVVGLFNPQLQVIPDWEMWIRLSNHTQFMAIAEPLVYCRQLPEYGSKYPSDNIPEHCLALETDLQKTIETVYAELPPELEQHKHRSYSYASLFLAQNILQHQNSDPAIAHNYLYQALEHDPLMFFSLDFSQLRWAISRQLFLLHCQQSDRYRHLLRLIQDGSSRSKVIMLKTREFSQNILNWMTEEA
jgi:glycosyltransferase involved in cell wall biosynthesis